MHRENGNRQPLIDLLLIVFGLLFVAVSSHEIHSLLVQTLGALGTGLIAAGLVHLLIIFSRNDERNADALKLKAVARINIEDDYRNLKFTAHTLEILSVALGGALRDFETNEQLLRNILIDKSKVKLIFLSPLSQYMEQRAREDDVSVSELKSNLTTSVERCEKIYASLCNLHKDYGPSQGDRDKVGDFEIRVTEECPYFTIYRADKTMLWGIYTSDRRGDDSAVFQVLWRSGEIAHQLEEHFNAVWDRNADRNWIVRYNRAVDTPKINRSRIDEILER